MDRWVSAALWRIWAMSSCIGKYDTMSWNWGQEKMYVWHLEVPSVGSNEPADGTDPSWQNPKVTPIWIYGRVGVARQHYLFAHFQSRHSHVAFRVLYLHCGLTTIYINWFKIFILRFSSSGGTRLTTHNLIWFSDSCMTETGVPHRSTFYI